MTKKISSLGNILMGLIFMTGPWFIFGVCSTEEKVMKCFWSCRALFALGLIATIIGLLVLFTKNKKITNEILISISLSLISMFIPFKIIGSCGKATMHCNTTTFPIIYAIAGVNILIQLFVLYKEVKSK